MKNLSKRLLALGLSATMMIAMVGCGSSSSNTSADGTSAAASAANSDNGTVILNIGSNADMLTSLDKYANTGFGSDDTGYLWGDPLISNDHQKNYTAALATDWTEADDHLSYTFTLREGVKFHNGDEMTAEDVAFSFNRIAADDTLAHKDSWSNLDRAEVNDDGTVTVYLSSVMPCFYDEIGFLPIISKSAYEADPENFFQKPIGTGAFSVESFDNLTGIVSFIRNNDWWGENTGNVDKIVYTPIMEDTTRASALQSGEIDIAINLTSDYHDTLDSAKYNLTDVIVDQHIHIEYNCAEDKLFNDKNLREALSLCIDRQLIVDNILGGGSVSTWPIPEGNVGYVSGQSYAYDLDKAKELVAASNYNGEEINLVYTSSSFIRADEVAQAVQSMAAEAGLNVTLNAMEGATFQDSRSGGNFDITLASFATTCGDPQVEASVIIGFDVFNSGFQNEEMSALAGQIREEADLEKRSEYLQQFFQIEMDEFAPFVYLYEPLDVYAMASNVSGATIYADCSGDYRFVTKE